MGEATAYDSVWARAGVPAQAPTGVEALMLSHDKLYVVLAVILIIWAGIVFLLWRTDQKLGRLERSVESGIFPEDRVRS